MGLGRVDSGDTVVNGFVEVCVYEASVYVVGECHQIRVVLGGVVGEEIRPEVMRR